MEKLAPLDPPRPRIPTRRGQGGLQGLASELRQGEHGGEGVEDAEGGREGGKGVFEGGAEFFCLGGEEDG